MKLVSSLRIEGNLSVGTTSASVTSAGDATFQTVSATSISGVNLFDTNFSGTKALISNSDKSIGESSTTSTQIAYLSGVTSDVQTQINSKLTESTGSSKFLPLSGGTVTGLVTLSGDYGNQLTIGKNTAGGKINFARGSGGQLTGAIGFLNANDASSFGIFSTGGGGGFKISTNGYNTVWSTAGEVSFPNTMSVAGNITASNLISIGGPDRIIQSMTSETNNMLSTHLLAKPYNYAYHDWSAFAAPYLYETTSDKTTWTSATVNTKLFDANPTTSVTTIASATSTSGVRWTWNTVQWSQVDTLIITPFYCVPPPCTFLVEVAVSGTTDWTISSSATITPSNTNPVYMTFPDVGGNSYLRVSIIANGAGDSYSITSLQLWTMRNGVQGKNKNNAIPFSWDYNKNITFSGNLTGTNATFSGQLTASFIWGKTQYVSIAQNSSSNADYKIPYIGTPSNGDLFYSSANGITINPSIGLMKVKTLYENDQPLNLRYLPLSGGNMSGPLGMPGAVMTSSTSLISQGINFSTYHGITQFNGTYAAQITGGVGAVDGIFIYGYSGVALGWTAGNGTSAGVLSAALRTNGANVNIAGLLTVPTVASTSITASSNINAATLNIGSGESKFWLGTYSDPHVGGGYAIKVGASGIAVNGNSLFNATVSAVNFVDTGFSGNKVLISNADKSIGESVTSTTQIGYLSAVTSDVQTQLNNKLNTNGSNASTSVKIAAAVESNAITTVQYAGSTITANAPQAGAALRSAIKFDWYATTWDIGNIRGSSTDTAGFGIATSAGTNLRWRVTNGVTYDYNNLIVTGTVSTTASLSAGTIFEGGASLASKYLGALSIATGSYFLNEDGTFKQTGQAGLQYYDADFTSIGTNYTTSGWAAPTSAWYQVLHMPLSVGGYFNELFFPVNDVSGLWWRQRRNAAYYGWFKILDSQNFNSYALPLTGGNLTGALSGTSISAANFYGTFNGSIGDAPYLPLSGGTLTSGASLYWPNSSTNGVIPIWGMVGDNDYWRIKAGATESNAGYLEIATADDGNEPIYVKQYTGVFTTLVRTLTLLDGSGNTIIPGNVSSKNSGLDTNAHSVAYATWGHKSATGSTVYAILQNSSGGKTFVNGGTNLYLRVNNVSMLDFSSSAAAFSVRPSFNGETPWDTGNLTTTSISNWNDAYNTAVGGSTIYTGLDGVTANSPRWKLLATIQLQALYETHKFQVASEFWGNQWSMSVEIDVLCTLNNNSSAPTAIVTCHGTLNGAEIYWKLDGTLNQVRIWLYRGGGNSIQTYRYKTIMSSTPGNITYSYAGAITACTDSNIRLVQGISLLPGYNHTDATFYTGSIHGRDSTFASYAGNDGSKPAFEASWNSGSLYNFVIRSVNNLGSTMLSIFTNHSSRSTTETGDGYGSETTIRSDNGNLRLGNYNTTTKIFGNVVTLTTRDDNSLQINGTSATVYNHAIVALNPTLTSANRHYVVNIGASSTAANLAYFGFNYWGGAGSTSNRLTMGLHSYDNLFTIDCNGTARFNTGGLTENEQGNVRANSYYAGTTIRAGGKITAGVAGFAFPDNAYGGGGDTAGMRLDTNGGEAMTLRLYATNDTDDTIDLSVPSNNGATVNGYTIYHSGNYNPLSANNTWTGTNTFNGTVTFNGNVNTYKNGTYTGMGAWYTNGTQSTDYPYINFTSYGSGSKISCVNGFLTISDSTANSYSGKLSFGFQNQGTIFGAHIIGDGNASTLNLNSSYVYISNILSASGHIVTSNAFIGARCSITTGYITACNTTILTADTITSTGVANIAGGKLYTTAGTNGIYVGNNGGWYASLYGGGMGVAWFTMGRSGGMTNGYNGYCIDLSNGTIAIGTGNGSGNPAFTISPTSTSIQTMLIKPGTRLRLNITTMSGNLTATQDHEGGIIILGGNTLVLPTNLPAGTAFFVSGQGYINCSSAYYLRGAVTGAGSALLNGGAMALWDGTRWCVG